MPAGQDIITTTPAALTIAPGMPALAPVTSPRAFDTGAGMQDQAAFLGFATATVTITGTVGSGPTVTVTIAGTPVLYTYVGGDTTTALAAQHIAAAIAANGTTGPLVTATAVSTNVITITAKAQGEAGQLTLNSSATGGAVATKSNTELDFSPGIVPASTASYAGTPGGGSMGAITLYKNEPREVDTATRNDLKANGLAL